MTGHEPSIIKAALDRLDAKMAIGQSRRQAKLARRAAGAKGWTFSTGMMHAYRTRSTYQQQILTFVSWARTEFAMHTLAALDAQAETLTRVYLLQQIAAGKSPYTLHTIRSALRLFFGNPHLAEALALPARRRTNIRRSRVPVRDDQHFQPTHWEPLLRFLAATGLRRHEVETLRVGDILEETTAQAKQVVIVVRRGKGGKARVVPVLAGQETAVLAVITNRKPDEWVFPVVPSHLDIHAYRRRYAQALYLQYASVQDQPLVATRGWQRAYNLKAVRKVSRALGHNRIDVIINHYLQ